MDKKSIYKATRLFTVGVLLLGANGCNQQESKVNHASQPSQVQIEEQQDIESDKVSQQEDVKMKQIRSMEELQALFEGVKTAQPIKKILHNNPVMTQRFGADPYAIVYEGRVYLYMTADEIEYDEAGKVKNNSYSKINKLNVVSSADLVNWTDHGSLVLAGLDGAAKWGGNSWAPAVAVKEVNGKTQFFIYFANGGNGIGVVCSDSPTGPFIDPIKKALISRETPNCANVDWLFDPAVLVDDDGRAYIYFGGGVPAGKEANPGTGRIAELGDNMISLKGEPIAHEIPFLFEDSGINKFGDTYYYSYCSNFSMNEEQRKDMGFDCGEIVTMTSKNPMGPFTLQGGILKNPGDFFGTYGNNHHCMFDFEGKHYIAYHSQMLEKPLGISGGYRSTNINEVHINEDGSIDKIKGTGEGVAQVKPFNPYEVVEAETMANMAGLDTVAYDDEAYEYCDGNMVVTGIDTGDWMCVKGVDFGTDGASKFELSAKLTDEAGAIKLCIDQLHGQAIGYVDVPLKDSEEYVTLTADLLSKVTGTHDLYFVFQGSGYSLDTWKFSK